MVGAKGGGGDSGENKLLLELEGTVHPYFLYFSSRPSTPLALLTPTEVVLVKL
jgi:hypothetical protein